MVYRPTEKTQARKAALKKQLLDAALLLVATGGFGALTIQAVAQQAGIATGAVYKHFESKAQLCAEVFRLATEKEVAVVRETALREGAPATRLLDTIETFAKRALRGQRLAYALIAEPVDTLVDAERLRPARRLRSLLCQVRTRPLVQPNMCLATWSHSMHSSRQALTRSGV